jgi:hypothetical protein
MSESEAQSPIMGVETESVDVNVHVLVHSYCTVISLLLMDIPSSLMYPSSSSSRRDKNKNTIIT